MLFHLLRAWNIAVLSAACFFSSEVFSSSSYFLYFFNPESNVDNFAMLKKSLDEYLEPRGRYQFRPFDDQQIFEKAVQGKKDGVFLISSWHYKTLRKKQALQALLVSTLDHKSTQNKILSAKREIASIAQLREHKIASAGTEAYTRGLLQRMLGESQRELVNNIQIITVPRDIDALISVSFGAAKAAITTEHSLAMLASINPVLFKRLRVMQRSEESLLPILAIAVNATPGVANLVTIIEQMQTTMQGKARLKMLGIDGWRRLSQTEKAALGE